MTSFHSKRESDNVILYRLILLLFAEYLGSYIHFMSIKQNSGIEKTEKREYEEYEYSLSNVYR